LDWETIAPVVGLSLTLAGLGYAALSAKHSRIAKGFFIAAALVPVGWLAHSLFVRAPETHTSDPERLCFIDFEVPLVREADRITELAIRVRVQNRYRKPVTIVLLDWSAVLEGFPRSSDVRMPEETVLFPEHGVVYFESDPIKLGRGVRPGMTIPGRVNFVIRHGPEADDAAVLTIKGRVWITFLRNGLADLRWLPDDDSTQDCVWAEHLVNKSAL
jgi:hypothetical protein